MAEKKGKQPSGIKFPLKKWDMETINSPFFKEYLRYAGVTRIDLDEGKVWITIWAPHGVNREVWADHNCGRTKSFGYPAEAVFS